LPQKYAENSRHKKNRDAKKNSHKRKFGVCKKSAREKLKYAKNEGVHLWANFSAF